MKKAEIGMGTLIIFIAMILVVAVAASVLIQTTGTLQSKALQSGKSTSREIGTSLNTLSVYGEDGSDQVIEYIYHTVKLTSGSTIMKFDDLLLKMSTNNISTDYIYNSSIDCGTESGFNSTAFGYGISYSIQGSSYKLGYLSRGDVVKICLRSTRILNEDDEFRLVLIPKYGSPHTINAYAPDMILNKREFIYP